MISRVRSQTQTGLNSKYSLSLTCTIVSASHLKSMNSTEERPENWPSVHGQWISTWKTARKLVYGKVSCHKKLYSLTFNPLSPNSDQDQFSANNIHTLSTDKLWELIKWSPKRKRLDLSSNSLNLFFKEMYGDQFGEFVCGYWGLKAKTSFLYLPSKC